MNGLNPNRKATFKVRVSMQVDKLVTEPEEASKFMRKIKEGEKKKRRKDNNSLASSQRKTTPLKSTA